MLESELLREELRELVARHGVRHDRAARIVRREDGRHHRDERVAADLLAVFEHGAHAVDIRIENQPEIGAAREHRLADRRHRLLVLRVRDVVREMAVRLEIAAARRIGAEPPEDLRRKEAAVTVARVDDDMHAL